MEALIVVFVLGLYFLPTINAASRKHHSSGAVFMLNLLLGWTFLGWVIAMVWSCAYVIPRETRPLPERPLLTPKQEARNFVIAGVVVAAIIVAGLWQRIGSDKPSQSTTTYQAVTQRQAVDYRNGR
jgi:uncharacterized membrane protein YbhN (UPF0104 family)